jgi:hypothetical protein
MGGHSFHERGISWEGIHFMRGVFHGKVFHMRSNKQLFEQRAPGPDSWDLSEREKGWIERQRG